MNPDNILKFLTESSLKNVRRKGWVVRKIRNAESVADHSWRMALMALLLSRRCGVDADKAVAMSLIHDIAESKTGDVIAKSRKERMEKERREKKAVMCYARILGKKRLSDLWNEYRDGRTKESRFVHQIDKLEMCLQAAEYEKSQKKNLDEFFASASEIKDIELRRMMSKILKMRK